MTAASRQTAGADFALATPTLFGKEVLEVSGFYLGRANLMQGPPLSAPMVFSGFAGAALVVLQLS